MSVGRGLRLNSAAKSVQEGLAGTAFSAAPVANGQVRTMRIRESGTAGRKPRTTPPLPAVACLHFPEQAFAKLTNSAADLVCTSTLALDRLSCRADARCRGDAADRYICNFCMKRARHEAFSNLAYRVRSTAASRLARTRFSRRET